MKPKYILEERLRKKLNLQCYHNVGMYIRKKGTVFNRRTSFQQGCMTLEVSCFKDIYL